MIRIRFHGRGGQGVKTASRILGSALFAEGFEVQDAPRYGAERRGAPVFAGVRAAHAPIYERGPIRRPDLVVVADDTLPGVPAAGVLAGVDRESVLLLATAEPEAPWAERLGTEARVLTLPSAPQELAELRSIGAVCAAAAARLLGVVGRASLETALREELSPLGAAAVEQSRARALEAWEFFADAEGCVPERAPREAMGEPLPAWVDLPFEPARVSAPDVHAAGTSVQVRTGLWRTMRPVVERERCRRCTWICGTLCPDGVISVGETGHPVVDYDHCKGCMVCVAVCPSQAIRAESERLASEAAAPQAAGEPA